MAEEHLGMLSRYGKQSVHVGSTPIAVPNRDFPLPPRYPARVKSRPGERREIEPPSCPPTRREALIGQA